MLDFFRTLAQKIGLIQEKPEDVVLAINEQPTSPTEPLTIHLKVGNFDLTSDDQWRSSVNCPLALAIKDAFPGKSVNVGIVFATVDGIDYTIDGAYTNEMYLADFKKIKRFKDKHPLRVVRTLTLVPQ